MMKRALKRDKHKQYREHTKRSMRRSDMSTIFIFSFSIFGRRIIHIVIFVSLFAVVVVVVCFLGTV